MQVYKNKISGVFSIYIILIVRIMKIVCHEVFLLRAKRLIYVNNNTPQ